MRGNGTVLSVVRPTDGWLIDWVTAGSGFGQGFRSFYDKGSTFPLKRF